MKGTPMSREEVRIAALRAGQEAREALARLVREQQLQRIRQSQRDVWRTKHGPYVSLPAHLRDDGPQGNLSDQRETNDATS